MSRGAGGRGGSWELASRQPHPVLGGYGVRYTGYAEDTPVPVARREAPEGTVTLILSFDHCLTVSMEGATRAPGGFVSFVAGLHDGPARTEHRGRQHGVQVDLSPLAAARVFGPVLADLANDVVALEQLPGRWGRELPERLAGVGSWARRFDLLDESLLRMSEDGPRPGPEVVESFELLRATGGRATIATLAGATGWSRRHLSARFGGQFGMSPKRFARVLRFRRAVELLLAPRPAPLVAIALACGYADQPHLNREFRALAGCTPTEYRAERAGDALATHSASHSSKTAPGGHP